MPSPIALDLLPATRRLLLLGIKERGEATAEQLARASYLSIAAVRMHLYSLESDGFVKHTRRRDGPGRPTHVFCLTPTGEELFPQGYAAIALALLAAIDSHPGCKAQVFDVLEQAQRSQALAGVSAATFQGRVEQLAGLQERQGFFPLWEVTSESDWKVTLRHCPFIRVASEHPEFCEIERRVIEVAIAQGTVQTVGSRVGGAPTCAFRVVPGHEPEHGSEAAGG
jgi:DeoR family suf operon transcriptional repressor